MRVSKASSVPTRARKSLLASADYLQAARTVVSVRTDAETIDSRDDDLLPGRQRDAVAGAQPVVVAAAGHRQPQPAGRDDEAARRARGGQRQRLAGGESGRESVVHRHLLQ